MTQNDVENRAIYVGDEPFTIIRNKIIQDSNLSWKARGIFAYIKSMPSDWSFYTSELAKHSTDGITILRNGLKELEENGYLKREQHRNSNTGRMSCSEWFFNDIPCFDPHVDLPHTEKPHAVNLTLQSTNNTKETLTKEYVEQAQQLEDPKPKKQNQPSFYKEVIDYLNIKTGKSYNYKASSNQKMIRARQREGYSLDDFKRVIDTKSAEWSNSETMAKYLRPATLFSTKFDTYLNQSNERLSEPPVDKKDKQMKLKQLEVMAEEKLKNQQVAPVEVDIWVAQQKARIERGLEIEL